MINRTAPLADSLTGQAIRTGKPHLVTGDRRQAAAAELGADIGPLIVAPLVAGKQVRGALILGRLAIHPGFTDTDLDMAASFAGHAAAGRMSRMGWSGVGVGVGVAMSLPPQGSAQDAC